MFTPWFQRSSTRTPSTSSRTSTPRPSTYRTYGRSIPFRSHYGGSVYTPESFNFNTIPRSRIGYISIMRACQAMMLVLEGQHDKSPMVPEPQFYNPPDDSLNEEKLSNLEQKIDDLERKLKLISRRVSESRRGQTILIERLEELENSLHKSRQITIVSQLLNVIPTEQDLIVLEKMKKIEASRKEVFRQIKNTELQNKILSKTLGRAEALISETPVIKKQKRVVIVEEEQIHYVQNLPEEKDQSSAGKTMPRYRGFRKVMPAAHDDDDEEEGEEVNEQEETNSNGKKLLEPNVTSNDQEEEDEDGRMSRALSRTTFELEIGENPQGLMKKLIDERIKVDEVSRGIKHHVVHHSDEDPEGTNGEQSNNEQESQKKQNEPDK